MCPEPCLRDERLNFDQCMHAPRAQIENGIDLPRAGGLVWLWVLSLDIPPDCLEQLGLTLSEQERQRALRFRFDTHRKRFVAGRGLMRTILGGCLGADPRLLEFVVGPFGKPGLGESFAAAEVQFNLAHCEDLAVLGVTRGARLGVDVERVRRLQDADELVARFFSQREAKAFTELEEASKPAAFFNLWTRKEAWLKATGEGIGRHLSRVEVSFVPGEVPRLKQLPAELGDAGQWTLHSLEPAGGFVAAVAVETTSSTLHLCASANEPMQNLPKLAVQPGLKPPP